MDRLLHIVNRQKDYLDMMLHTQEILRVQWLEQLEKRMNDHKLEMNKLVQAYKDELDKFVSEFQLQGKHKVLTLNSN